MLCPVPWKLPMPTLLVRASEVHELTIKWDFKRRSEWVGVAAAEREATRANHLVWGLQVVISPPSRVNPSSRTKFAFRAG